MRQAEPQTERQLFREEFGAGMDHLRRAFGYAGSMAGPRFRAARAQWGPAAAGRLRNRRGGRGGKRQGFPLGLVALGIAAGAAAAVLLRRRRQRRQEEYDAEMALEEITEGGAVPRDTGMVADESRARSGDQQPT